MAVYLLVETPLTQVVIRAFFNKNKAKVDGCCAKGGKEGRKLSLKMAGSIPVQ